VAAIRVVAVGNRDYSFRYVMVIYAAAAGSGALQALGV
jgi:hypothetical protein